MTCLVSLNPQAAAGLAMAGGSGPVSAHTAQVLLGKKAKAKVTRPREVMPY